MTFSSSALQPFLIISDSHGKCLDSINITSNYRIETYSIPGLQWINQYDPNLCLFSLIQKDPFSSLLHSTSYVLFIVATNSVRSLLAAEIINQIDQVFTFIYTQYFHLRNQKIILTTCMPCLKISKRFPTIASLMNNIDYYNQLLFTFSNKYNFLCFDLQIPKHWLSNDMMHVGYQHRHEVSNILLNYINCLHVNDNPTDKCNRRSPEATYRRNKKRNLKQKQIQKKYTLFREVSSQWTYAHLKYFLKLSGIPYSSLSVISNNTLCLRFSNSLHLMYANHSLFLNNFNSTNFTQCFQEH